MTLVQLPAVHCVGVDFRTLREDGGAVASAALMAARRTLLLQAFDACRPDVVVTELFPFGRRQLAAEFDALVAAARGRQPRPALVASVRDIWRAARYSPASLKSPVRMGVLLGSLVAPRWVLEKSREIGHRRGVILV